MSGQQQTLDLGRPTFAVKTTDLASVPPSPHKCGDCRHLQAHPNPRHMACTHVHPGRMTKRWLGSEACPKFAPEGGVAK